MRNTEPESFEDRAKDGIDRLGPFIKDSIYKSPLPEKAHVLAPNFRSDDQDGYAEMWVRANSDIVSAFKANEHAIRRFEIFIAKFYEQYGNNVRYYLRDPEVKSDFINARLSVKGPMGSIFRTNLKRLVNEEDDELEVKIKPVVEAEYLDCNFRNFNLAFYLYALCAQQRRDIAEELNQDGAGIFQPKKYGLFVDKAWGQPHDLVSPHDIRFAVYYLPLKEVLRLNLPHSGEQECSFDDPPRSPNFVVDLPISGKPDIKCKTFHKDRLSERQRRLYGIPERIFPDSPFVIMRHGHLGNIRDMFFQINLHLHAILKLEHVNPEIKLIQLYYHLANIMFYLGNVVPLKAGSAAATENFIQCILKKINLPPAVYQPTRIPWYFLCKVTTREQFTKLFPRLLSRPLMKLEALRANGNVCGLVSSSALFSRLAREQMLLKMHSDRNDKLSDRETFDRQYGLVPR